jgi:hypothetical protein
MRFYQSALELYLVLLRDNRAPYKETGNSEKLSYEI